MLNNFSDPPAWWSFQTGAWTANFLDDKPLTELWLAAVAKIFHTHKLTVTAIVACGRLPG